MSDFEDTIIGIFDGATEVVAIVGKNVWFDEAPPDQKGPFVVCYQVATNPTHSTDNGEAGSSRLDNVRMQVSFWARDKKEVKTLGKAIRKALERARPTVCIMTDERASYDTAQDLRGKIQEYSVWHPDTVPA